MVDRVTQGMVFGLLVGVVVGVVVCFCGGCWCVVEVARAYFSRA